MSCDCFDRNLYGAALVKNLSKKGGKKRARVKNRARQAGVMGDTISDLNQKAVSTWT